MALLEIRDLCSYCMGSKYRSIGFDIYEKQKIKYVEVIGNIHDNPELLEVEE